MGNRFRNYNIVFYGSEGELCKILRLNSDRISKYAYCVHDKDVYLEDRYDDDGNLVTKKGDIERVHIHCNLEFFNALSFNACKRMFTTECDNPRVERTIDKQAMFEYLVHKNDKDKFQYPYDSIVSNDIVHFEKLCKFGEKIGSDDKAIQIVEDILKGVSKRLLMYRYGRDVIINFERYEAYARLIKDDTYMESIKSNPKLMEITDRELEQLEVPFD